MTDPRPPRRRRRRVLIALAGVMLFGAIAFFSAPLLLPSLGGRVTGARLARARATNHHDGEAFVNVVPTSMMSGGFWDMAKRQFAGGEVRVPQRAIPVEPRRKADYAQAPPSGLRATWIGHATTLLEIDGRRVLTDPIWSERCSPVSFVGPRRFHPPPIPLADLPHVDAVVISHDHFDHLDMATVKTLAARGTRIVVPLGIGAHLERWDLPAASFVELDWWQKVDVAGLTITSTPSRHYSGRFPGRGDEALWSSWSVAGPRHRIFFSGDTGYGPMFAEIGARLGPFDLTVVKIGAYGENWPDIHVTPEEALRIHADVRGRVMLGVHWGTFNLAYHQWHEPADRLRAAATASRARVVLPAPGAWFEPATVGDGAPVTAWWR